MLVPGAVALGLFGIGSVAIMFVAMCAAGIAAIAVAPPGIARNVFLVFCTICFCLAGAEGVLRVSGGGENLSLKWQRGRAIYRSAEMLQRDEALGYVLAPNGAYRYTMLRDGAPIYDVVYTIDGQGGRVTPPVNDGRMAIMLAGESFNFGEGLRDDQTLGYHLQQRARQTLRVPNIAVSGYGLHQTLRQLEVDVPGRYGRHFDWLVLSVVDNHIERVNGDVEWSGGTPRFELDRSGQPVLTGTFADTPPPAWLQRFRAGSRLFYAASQAWIVLMPSADTRLFVALLRKVQDVAVAKYGARVLVLYYPGHTTYNDYVGRRDLYRRLFAEAGVRYIDVSEAIPDLDASYYIAGDGHPAEKMNEVVSDLVLQLTGLAAR